MTTRACSDGGGPLYCDQCGWLIAPEGVSILPEDDVPREDAAPRRCDDTACTAERTR